MKKLRALGLTAYEIGVYKALLTCGPSTARSIASNSQVPPTAVYPNVKSLISKGLAQQSTGDVSIFEAIEPRVALDALAKKKAQGLLDAKEDAISELEHLGKKQDNPVQVVSLSHGLDASHSITQSFLQSAQQSVYCLGWKFRTPQFRYELMRKFVQLQKQGLDVRILLTTNEEQFVKPLRQYMEKGIPIRHFPLKDFSIIIKDGSECKITLKGEMLKDRMNVHIREQQLASFLHKYFLSVWKNARTL